MHLDQKEVKSVVGLITCASPFPSLCLAPQNTSILLQIICAVGVNISTLPLEKKQNSSPFLCMPDQAIH